MTLEEYIDSEFVESNWLIRFLVNRRQDGVLGYEQVAVAKELLRRKFLIGLYNNLEESIARIEVFFAWTVVSPPGRAEGAKLCHDEMINNARQRDKDDFAYMNTKLQYGDSNYNHDTYVRSRAIVVCMGYIRDLKNRFIISINRPKELRSRSHAEEV